MGDLKVRAATPIACSIAVPGDARLGVLAVLLAALADGTSRIDGLPPTRCILGVVEAVRALGVRVDAVPELDGPTVGAGAGISLSVHGVKSGFQPPDRPIECGDCAGAAALIALLVTQPFRSELHAIREAAGPAILSLIEQFGGMGARIMVTPAPDGLRLVIEGGALMASQHRLDPCRVEVAGAILLARVLSPGKSIVTGVDAAVDQAARVFQAFGIGLRRDADGLVVHGGQRPEPRRFAVPGDISLAACWLTAAAAQPGGELQVTNVTLNPTRTGVLKVLARMGASVQEIVETKGSGEPAGRLILRGAALRATVIDGPETRAIGTELPFLAVAAALADGTTVIREVTTVDWPAGGLVEPLTDMLRRFGATVRVAAGSMEIDGPARLRAPRRAIEPPGHPIFVMAAALAGLFADGVTEISGTSRLDTMYPGFENELSRFQSSEASEAERVPVVGGVGGARPQVVVKFDQPKSGIVIAIDGPAASGKSTVSRDLARALGFVHVNSGAMYRAVTRAVLDAGIDPSDAGAVDACLRRLRIECGLRDGEGTVEVGGVVADGLSAADVNAAVSAVARIPAVRAALFPLQRRYAELANIVMEGRDIGSAIFPETPYKYYVDASPEVRARRRAAQGLADSVTERDRQDSTREVAPLRLADGARVIDSSDLTVEKVVACIVDDLRAKGLVV